MAGYDDNTSPTDDHADDATEYVTIESSESDWMLWDKNKIEW